jgi:hypothetical protein
MTVSISKLLNKKGWTGKELGRIEIANMVKIFSDNRSGVKNPEPIVPMDKLRSMVRSLETNAQIDDYNGYVAIHRWLIDRYNHANANRLQALFYITRLQHYINSSLMAQRVYDYIASLPLIMTQKQYDEAKAKAREKWLKGDDGSGEIGYSLLGLLFRAFYYYENLLEKKPEAANPLKKVEAKYRKEKLGGKFALSNYNKMAQIGYYSLPDGRTSEKLTPEEWRAAVLKDDIDPTRPFNLTTRAITAYGNLQHILKGEYSVLYFSDRPDDKPEQDFLKSLLKVPLKWNVSKEEPDLTKWDFLTQDVNLWEIYYNGELSDKEQDEATKEVLEQFKELADLLIKDIDSKYFPKDKTMEKTPLKEWKHKVFTFEELDECDFYDFKELYEAPSSIFDGNPRGLFNGVAILQPELGYINTSIDKDGNYREPKLQEELLTLENLLPNCDFADKMIERVEEAYLMIREALYRLNGYNISIDVISKEFNIDIEIFKTDLDYIKGQLEVLEAEKKALAHAIKLSSDARGLQETDARLELLEKYFPPINPDEIKPDEAKIEEAKKLMVDYKAFIEPEDERAFYNLLFTTTSTIGNYRVEL